jgi:hypothetical protein
MAARLANMRSAMMTPSPKDMPVPGALKLKRSRTYQLWAGEGFEPLPDAIGR